MDVITTQQAADKLGVTRNRVLALIKAGRLPSQRIGNQHLIRRADLAKVRVRRPGRPKKTK